ncbi:DMBT1-like protein, partial [Mya arenaria]
TTAYDFETALTNIRDELNFSITESGEQSAANISTNMTHKLYADWRMFLKISKTATIHDRSKYGYGSGSLVVEDLNCTGTEDNLDECGSYPWSEGSASPSCNSHYYDVGVNCRPNTPIRLVNGTNATKYSGRVEIEYDGKWGPICDRSFDAHNAKVICRMLGLNT